MVGPIGDFIDEISVLLFAAPNHERARSNLAHFLEQAHESNPEKPNEMANTEDDFSWMSRTMPQNVLKEVDWYHERAIFKRLCRGDPMPQVRCTFLVVTVRWGPLSINISGSKDIL